MNLIREEKQQLRNKIKIIKDNFSNSYKLNQSEQILKKIEKLEFFKNANDVLLYWSMDDEVRTHEFIIKWSTSKKIFLPVILEDELEVREFVNIESMQKSSKFPIVEPTGKSLPSLNIIDLVILPGVAFDRHNNRLGYGKGYYDKLLPQLDAYKIGICYNFQLFDEIPHDEYDIKMDQVISNFE